MRLMTLTLSLFLTLMVTGCSSPPVRTESPSATSPVLLLPEIPDRSAAFKAAQARRQRALEGTKTGDPQAALEMVELGLWDEMAELQPNQAPLVTWKDDATEVIPGLQRRQLWSDLYANWLCRQKLDKQTIKDQMNEALDRLLQRPFTTHPVILRETAWLLEDYRNATLGDAPNSLKALYREIHLAVREISQKEQNHPNPLVRATRIKLFADYTGDKDEWFRLMGIASQPGYSDPLTQLDVLREVARQRTVYKRSYYSIDENEAVTGWFSRSGGGRFPENYVFPEQIAWEKTISLALSSYDPAILAPIVDESMTAKTWNKERTLDWAKRCYSSLRLEQKEIRALLSLFVSQICGMGFPSETATIARVRYFREQQRFWAIHSLSMVGKIPSRQRSLALIEQADADLALGSCEGYLGVEEVGREISDMFENDAAATMVEAQVFLDRFMPWWISIGAEMELLCLPIEERVEEYLRKRKGSSIPMCQQRIRNLIMVSTALGKHGKKEQRSLQFLTLSECIYEANRIRDTDLEISAYIASAENREQTGFPDAAQLQWLLLANRYREISGSTATKKLKEYERRAGITEDPCTDPIQDIDVTQGQYPKRICQLAEKISTCKDKKVLVSLAAQIQILVGWEFSIQRTFTEYKEYVQKLRQQSRLGSRECELILRQLGEDEVSWLVRCLIDLGPRPLGPISQKAIQNCNRNGSGQGASFLFEYLLQEEPESVDGLWSTVLEKTWGDKQQYILKKASESLPKDRLLPVLRKLLSLPAKDLHGTAGKAIPLLAKLTQDMPKEDLRRIFKEGSWDNDKTQALLALAMIRDESIESSVLQLIDDERAEFTLRSAAIRCAAALRFKAAIPKIQKLLLDSNQDGNAGILRDEVLSASVILGVAVPEDRLRSWMMEDWGEEPDANALDFYGPFQRWRIVASSVIGVLTTDIPEAKERLRFIFQHPWVRYRCYAVTLLGRSGHPRAAKIILEMATLDSRLQPPENGKNLQENRQFYLTALSGLPLTPEERQSAQKFFGSEVPPPPPPIMPTE